MGNIKENYKSTIYSCFIGYIVQAVVNNFVPLLFITFQEDYNIPLSKITLLVTFNFGIQLIIDLLSAGFIDKAGYRASLIIAHIFAATGLFLLTVLPDVMPDAFTGILISVTFYAIGGGLIEVLVSPVLESCPADNKEKAMSLLHSFYCWGHVAVVLLSTIFFRIFGTGEWKYLTFIWIIIPVCNIFILIKAPIAPLIEYMNSVLSQDVFHDMEQRTFVKMMEEAAGFLYIKDPERLTPGYMEWVCLRLLGIKGYKDMELWCDRSRQLYPSELLTYTCQLKLYFTIEDKAKFFDVLNRLRQSDIVIDKEALELIRIFS